MALNPRQRAFVREYCKDKNASRAYRAAGYPGKGGEVSACQLLKNPKVREAVDKRLAQLEAQIDYSVEKTFSKIAEIAYHSPRVHPNVKLKACELLAKHFGALTEKTELTVKETRKLDALTDADLEQAEALAKKIEVETDEKPKPISDTERD